MRAVYIIEIAFFAISADYIVKDTAVAHVVQIIRTGIVSPEDIVVITIRIT